MGGGGGRQGRKRIGFSQRKPKQLLSCNAHSLTIIIIIAYQSPNLPGDR